MKTIDAEELIRWIKERCEIVKEENILISSNVIIDRINTLISVNELDKSDVIKLISNDELREECEKRGYVMDGNANGYDD